MRVPVTTVTKSSGMTEITRLMELEITLVTG